MDSILYPKDSKKSDQPNKKRRAGVGKQDVGVGQKDELQVPGLKGYGKSGARVSQILSELNAKNLLEKAQTNIREEKNSKISAEKARAMANINESIVSKVESMIETKKKPEKVFNNNPPKKEVVQRSNQDDNLQRTQGWNTHFNAKYVNNKNPSRQEDSPNRRPY